MIMDRCGSRKTFGEREDDECAFLLLDRFNINCNVKAYRFPGTAQTSVRRCSWKRIKLTLSHQCSKPFDLLTDLDDIAVFGARRERMRQMVRWDRDSTYKRRDKRSKSDAAKVAVA